MLDLESVRCFDAAATTLNFRAAAARVHLSPAALSDRIRRLEDDLGVSLFHRSTRRVALSEAGERLWPVARRLLGDAERLRAAAKDDEAAIPFELTVGTRFELGLSWLVPGLSALAEERPERTVHLYMGDSPDLLGRLERGDIDAMVTSVRLGAPGLAYAALHAEEYVFVGTSPDFRGPQDAPRHVLCDVTRDLPLFRYILDAHPDGVPWAFARIEYLGGIGAIRRRLLDGQRVAVLPRYFVEPDLLAGRLVPLLPEVQPRTDAFRLVWRRGHPREDELVALAASLRKRPLS